MEHPKYDLITMTLPASKRLAERWQVELDNALQENQLLNSDRLLDDDSDRAKYSLINRLAESRSKIEAAVSLVTVQVTVFDWFQYEIRDTYRTYFRDAVYDLELTDDIDAQDLKAILDEFYAMHPNLTVVTIVPLDWDGRIGLVVMPKQINPSD